MLPNALSLATPVDIPPFSSKITFPDGIMMAGSCFAEHISRKLSRYKYQVVSNPFGILYNPASIATSFQRISKQEIYTADELVFHDGLYHSMDHHGSFSAPDINDALSKINEAIQVSKVHLEKSKFVFVSLGTSRVYQYLATSSVVGNNHKIPHTHFKQHNLTVSETLNELQSISSSINQLSSEAKIIWTVSPIRHLKDGLIENQRSKAVLILAIEEFIRAQNNSYYFPAYEIMMDQLRDYRFYARDMLHPSELAIDIIWEIFSQTFLSIQESEHHVAMEKIKRAMEHRFLHENKAATKSFAQTQLRNIDHLVNLFPEMNWKEERQYFFHLTEPD